MRFRRLELFARRLSLLVLIAALGSGPVGAVDSLYDVAKVSVDITAKDAVAARDKGMVQAEMRAMKVVLDRLVPLSLQDQLPEFTKDEVEGLVSGIAIRKEQTSTTRYIATLDVRFNAQAVQQLLASYGIPFSEERAPSISILPVMLTAEGLAGEGPEGWRGAWENLDLTHGLTPATILRPRADLDPGKIKAVLAGDPDAFTAMQSSYGYGGLVIAVGEVKGGKFVTRLAGEDGVGAITFIRDDAISGDPAKAAREGAAASFAMIENRWRMMRSGGEPPAAAAVPYEEGVPGAPMMEETPAAAVHVEVPRNVVALVEFSGLRDWQQIRTRLAQMAGIQGLEVNALSARTASITFDFAGSLDRLQATLGENGFALDERDGTFVVRSR
jgi:Uncharacterized protein conserved in bacteria (DUF2066)